MQVRKRWRRKAVQCAPVSPWRWIDQLEDARTHHDLSRQGMEAEEKDADPTSTSSCGGPVGLRRSGGRSLRLSGGGAEEE